MYFPSPSYLVLSFFLLPLKLHPDCFEVGHITPLDHTYDELSQVWSYDWRGQDLHPKGSFSWSNWEVWTLSGFKTSDLLRQLTVNVRLIWQTPTRRSYYRDVVGQKLDLKVLSLDELKTFKTIKTREGKSRVSRNDESLASRLLNLVFDITKSSSQ